ncbi:MFS general substrate transporter, partial [Aspergillus heteromorphus CBS 117.55]
PFSVGLAVLDTLNSLTEIGCFLASVDESLVSTTYSTIASQFQRLTEGAWLLVAYNFGYCVSLPVYGLVSDLYDKKKVLLCSYFLFILGSVGCGASTSLVQLTLARVIAGMGGAGMIVLVSIVLTDLMPPEDVAVYRSYENTIYITGRSLGAPLGGLLIDTIGWRWSFIGQTPIAITCALSVAYLLPNLRKRTLCRDSTPSRCRIFDLDFLGIITFSITIILLLFLLHTVGIPEQNWIVVPALTLPFTLSLLILIEVYWAERPLIPIDLMGKPLGAYCLVQFLLFTGRNALVSSLVPYFIRVENTSDLIASLSFVLTSLGVSAGGLISGYIIKRSHRYKTMTLVALVFSILIYLTIYIQWQDGCSLLETVSIFFSGLTMGIVFSTQFVGMSASSPPSRLATCIGTFCLSQQLGFIVGPAAGLSLIQRVFGERLMDQLGLAKEQLVKQILDDARFARKLSPALRDIARESYLHAFRVGPALALGCNVVALGMVWCLREQRVG